MSRLVRMCLAQPGYGSGLTPPVYTNDEINSNSVVLLVFSLNKTFLILFFHSSKIFSKIFSQYYDYYLRKN